MLNLACLNTLDVAPSRLPPAIRCQRGDTDRRHIEIAAATIGCANAPLIAITETMKSECALGQMVPNHSPTDGCMTHQRTRGPAHQVQFPRQACWPIVLRYNPSAMTAVIA